MRKTFANALLALFLIPIASEAQTVTGRLEPRVYREPEDPELSQYLYHDAWWSLDVPSTEELHYSLVIDRYYKRTPVALIGLLACRQSRLYGQEGPLLLGSYDMEQMVNRVLAAAPLAE